MDLATYSGPLLAGAWVTIQLTFYSSLIGLAFAFIFGVGRTANNPAIRLISVSFIEFFRGTSLLVQLF